MRKNNILFVLTGLLFLWASCSDDIIEQIPDVAGQNIKFGASTTSVKTSRTSYTGEIIDGFEGVNWKNSDEVRLYCPQSSTVDKYADYVINEMASNSASLSKIGDAGLQWGKAENHEFFAVYPSPLQYQHAGVSDEDILQRDCKFVGYIPKNQIPTSVDLDKSEKKYVYVPEMSYAYMSAKSIVPANRLGDPVALTFSPFVTTLNLSLKNTSNTDISLSGVSVSSKGNDGNYIPLYGKFEAILSKLDAKTRYPETNDLTAKEKPNIDRSSVFVSLLNGMNQQVTLKSGESLEFTVFILPSQDLSNIELTLHSGAGIKRGIISGVTIKKYKKNFIRNIPMDLDFSTANSNWITYLPDNALVNQMSIPGAGGVGSASLSDEMLENSDIVKEQTLDVTSLWNRGIRIFEFSLDCPNDNEDFFNQKIICNGVSTNLTFQQTLNDILKPLSENKGEFAMVIINYQASTSRDPNKFMAALTKCWKGVRDVLNQKNLGTMLYDPATTTIGEARGKLFCIARPTSKGEDDRDEKYSDFAEGLKIKPENVDKDILVINGWGSLKDKWIERGYTTKKSNGAGFGEDNKINHPFIYYSWQPIYNTFSVDASELNADFTYDVQLGNRSVNKAAWVQEWARVSKGMSITGSGWEPHHFWANSLDEKKMRIESTFDKTMYMTSAPQSIFINSLCGYFVDEDIPTSYTPYCGTDCIGDTDGGVAGNVKDYAKTINQYAYDIIFQRGLFDVTGPLGIVLMDRIDNDPMNSPANTNLPGLIVANNFRYDMELKKMPNTNRSAHSKSKQYDFLLNLNK